MDCIDESIKEYIGKNLTEKRLRHTYGVTQEAVKLAEIHGADPRKARTAALAHDMVKSLPQERLDEYVKELGLPERYIGNANLAHSKIAAALAEREFGIRDEDILNAIAFHTTGRQGMSDLEKIVFLADAIELGRIYPGVDDIRQKSLTDLDGACLMYIENTIKFLKTQGASYIDEDTTRAEEWFRQKEESD